MLAPVGARDGFHEFDGVFGFGFYGLYMFIEVKLWIKGEAKNCWIFLSFQPFSVDADVQLAIVLGWVWCEEGYLCFQVRVIFVSSAAAYKSWRCQPASAGCKSQQQLSPAPHRCYAEKQSLGHPSHPFFRTSQSVVPWTGWPGCS